MQNIELICVGKLNMDFCAAGVAEYAKRLGALCSFRMVELPEARLDKNAGEALVAQALEKEADAILANVRHGAGLVALCVEGKTLSSEELADFVARRAVAGVGDLAFVIGSSCGLSPRIKQAAVLRLSMGRMTLPHQLARLVLTEQLYRAFTINKGMKYHK